MTDTPKLTPEQMALQTEVWNRPMLQPVKLGTTSGDIPVNDEDEQFSDTVWEALKGDHNDLRKQAIILRAHRAAIARAKEKSS